MDIRVIHLTETDSTNRFVHDCLPTKETLLVRTDYQTAGRGQGTNRWESAYGKNLLFSLLIHPKSLKADQFFKLSMLHALAMKDTVEHFITQKVLLKWPNDLYVGQQKLGGILIETAIKGKNIDYCIYGTGLNVNQMVFESDAPNPVSMAQLTDSFFDVDRVLQRFITVFPRYLSWLSPSKQQQLHDAYHAALYRAEGFHCYQDNQGPFEARLVEVLVDGRICLEDSLGRLRFYSFKEVAFVNDGTDGVVEVK